MSGTSGINGICLQVIVVLLDRVIDLTKTFSSILPNGCAVKQDVSIVTI
jgi:hypothetical protein